jgi:hypothetical protein
VTSLVSARMLATVGWRRRAAGRVRAVVTPFPPWAPPAATPAARYQPCLAVGYRTRAWTLSPSSSGAPSGPLM